MIKYTITITMQDRYKGIFTSFFKDKKSQRRHKTMGIKVFLAIFA
jgi:hypothetical protein